MRACVLTASIQCAQVEELLQQLRLETARNEALQIAEDSITAAIQLQTEMGAPDEYEGAGSAAPLASGAATAASAAAASSSGSSRARLPPAVPVPKSSPARQGKCSPGLEGEQEAWAHSLDAEVSLVANMLLLQDMSVVSPMQVRPAAPRPPYPWRHSWGGSGCAWLLAAKPADDLL